MCKSHVCAHTTLTMTHNSLSAHCIQAKPCINCSTSLAGAQLGMPSVKTKVLGESRKSCSIPCSAAKPTGPSCWCSALA